MNRPPTAFAKVGRDDPDCLEAGFFRGLSLLFSGDYAKAEGDFSAVARVLPLAEVLNNQGVAVSRQGQDGTVLSSGGGRRSRSTPIITSIWP